VVCSDRAFIVADHYVHHTAEAVLDGQLTWDDRPEKVRQHDQRCDVIARLAFDLAAEFPRTFRDGDSVQAWPPVPFSEPFDIMDSGVGAALNPAITGVDRLCPTELWIDEVSRLLPVNQQFHIIAQRSLITFQFENIIGLLSDDLSYGYALTTHRVDGDDRPLDRPSIASRLNSFGTATISLDFLLLSLPKQRRWLVAKTCLCEDVGGHHMEGALPALPPDRGTVFPSIATTPTGTRVSGATQATKQRWNCCADWASTDWTSCRIVGSQRVCSVAQIACVAARRVKALAGRVNAGLKECITERHRFLQPLHLRQADTLHAAMTDIDKEVKRELAAFRHAIRLLRTIPGLIPAVQTLDS
jgi:hypothetical protein